MNIQGKSLLHLVRLKESQNNVDQVLQLIFSKNIQPFI